jgi:hypothetical protein
LDLLNHRLVKPRKPKLYFQSHPQRPFVSASRKEVLCSSDVLLQLLLAENQANYAKGHPCLIDLNRTTSSSLDGLIDRQAKAPTNRVHNTKIKNWPKPRARSMANSSLEAIPGYTLTLRHGNRVDPILSSWSFTLLKSLDISQPTSEREELC